MHSDGVSNYKPSVAYGNGSSAQSVTLTGKLRVLQADLANGTTRTNFFLELSNATMINLEFANPPPRDYPNRLVRVVGTLTVKGSEKHMQVASIGLAPGPLAPITAAAVSGNQPTLVILVKYSDISAEPHTNSYFVSDILSSTSPSLNLYYQENSFNLVTGITGNVVGWHALPHPYSHYTSCTGGASNPPCDDYLRNDAVNSVTEAVSWSSYTRLIIIVNSNLGCACAFAFIGPLPQATPGGTFAYSESFIPDDGWGATVGHGFGVIAHEYGHGLGLWHSGYNYNSLWDVMSGGTYASTGPVHTIGYQKIQLGWVSGSGIQTVVSGSYALNVVVNQLETNPPPGGVQVVKVVTSVSTRYYTIEVRERIGYDQGLPPTVGVIIHYVDDSLSDWMAQVDLPPSGTVCGPGCSDTSGAAWQIGQTLIDSANSIKIVIKSSTTTSFTLDINPPPTLPITFTLNGVAGDATGTILTVDSSTYQFAQFPITLSLTLTTHTVAATTTLPGGTSKQYVWLSWSDSQPASHTITVTAPATYTITYKTQYGLSIAVTPSGGGATNPSVAGSPYWEDAGTSVPVSANPNADYSFYYWSLDGTNVGSAVPYSVLMNAPHTLTAYFRSTSTISLFVSASFVSVGSSVKFSGTITPTQPSPGIPSGTTVTLSYSIDGGTTWNYFLITQTNSTSGYSAIWYPPYPNTYSIRAIWNGDQNYAGSTSSSLTLTVTGTLPAKISLLISGPPTVMRGGAATFDVLINNPGSTVTTTIYMEVIGPGGYSYFDTQTISLPSSSRVQFTWQVPSSLQAGDYQVTVGLIPPTSASISQTRITIT